MGRIPVRVKLALDAETRAKPESIAKSRTDGQARIERAKVLLEKIHQAYSPETRILIVLDNHSAHISKETQAYLKTRPNRFEFVFTPKHGSRLNLVEVFSPR